MNPYTQSADAYLVQRVMGASPEQQAALLMEAGQRFIGRAIVAIGARKHGDTAHCLKRVTDIIAEADLRLNREDGGELVQNLERIYDWWTREVLEASITKDTVKLEAVSRHMGELRQAWEQLHEKQVKAGHAAEFQLANRVV